MKHTMMRKMAMLVSALVALTLLIYGLSLSPLAHAASTDNASGNTTSSTSGSAANNASGSATSSNTRATVPSQCTAIIPAGSSAQQAGLDLLIQPSGDIKDGPDGPDGNPTSFTQAFSFNNTTTRQGVIICITVPGEKRSVRHLNLRGGLRAKRFRSCMAEQPGARL